MHSGNGCARALLSVVAAASCLLPACPGQTPLAEGSTIRVYANLLQIPVLILSRQHQPLPAIDPNKFLVRLGKEQPFRPRRVRQQGEDPITLAILLDGSAPDSLLPLLMQSLPNVAGKVLTGRDRVALYAMDGCKLRRLFVLLPANTLVIEDGVARAAAFPPYAASQHSVQGCGEAIGLWDAMDYMTRTLANEPGRRVVLAVTNGHDLGSRVQPEELRKDANSAGVAIFSVAERYKVPLLGPVARRMTAGWEVTSWLEEITEGSGGMVIETTRNNLSYTFNHFVQLLRGRYIVEFPRPGGLTGGTSTINISFGTSRAFIRPAGTSVPIADPVARDPAVQHGSVPSPPSGALTTPTQLERLQP